MKKGFYYNLLTILLLVCFSNVLLASQTLWQEYNNDKKNQQISSLMNNGELNNAEKSLTGILNSGSKVFVNYQLCLINHYNGKISKRNEYLSNALKAAEKGSIQKKYLSFLDAAWEHKIKDRNVFYKVLLNELDANDLKLTNAIYQFSNNHHSKSIEILNELVKKDKSFGPRFWLISAYYEKGDYDNVKKLAQEYLDQFPDNVPLNHLLGQSLLNTGDYSESLAIYEKLLKIQPDNLNFHCCYGKNCLFDDKPENALGHFQYILNSLDQEQLNWKCYWNIATCYTLLNQKDNALSVLNQFLAKCEKKDNIVFTSTIYHKLGDFNYLHNDFDNAIIAYDKWIDFVNNSTFSDQFKNEQLSNYYCKMMEISVLQNDDKSFKSYVTKYNLLKNKTNLQDCNKIKGLIAFNNKDYELAIQSFNIISDCCDINMWKALVFEKINNSKMAMNFYNQIISQKSTNFYSVLYKKNAKEKMIMLLNS